MMRKKLKKVIISFICMLTISVVILPGLSCSGDVINEPYDYPMKPGTPEWKAFTSHNEMLQACQIPEQIIKRLTTPALVETVLTYPLMGDMLAFNSPQQGFDSVSSQFDGFCEMFARSDIGNELMNLYQAYDPVSVGQDWTSLQQGQYTINLYKMEIILAQKGFILT